MSTQCDTTNVLELEQLKHGVGYLQGVFRDGREDGRRPPESWRGVGVGIWSHPAELFPNRLTLCSTINIRYHVYLMNSVQ